MFLFDDVIMTNLYMSLSYILAIQSRHKFAYDISGSVIYTFEVFLGYGNKAKIKLNSKQQQNLNHDLTYIR